MGSADENLGPACGVADFHYIDLDPIPFLQGFRLDPLVGGENCFRKLAVGGDTDTDSSGPLVDMGNNTRQDFMLLGGKFLIDQAALRLADSLDDYLFGCLRGNTPKLLRLHRDANHIAFFDTS